MMKKWIIESGDVLMGVYEGDTREDALDAYARDAGYESFEAMQQQVPGVVRAYAYDDLDPRRQARIRTLYPNLF